jgi:hypothetical protein
LWIRHSRLVVRRATAQLARVFRPGDKAMIGL